MQEFSRLPTFGHVSSPLYCSGWIQHTVCHKCRDAVFHGPSPEVLSSRRS